jgi:plastocyanin
VGGSGGSGGQQLHPDFTVTAQLDSANTTLGVSHQVTATVTPADGFTGAVALTATGLPNGWTFQAQNATITGAQPVMVQGTLNVPTDATAGAVSFDLEASGGGKMHSAALSITVKGELIIHIAQGVQTTNNTAAFGPNPTAVPFVPPGTKITWINDDSIAHRIHADGVNGFDHEPTNMNPGQSYSVTVTAGGQYPYHCHIHTGMIGQINVGQ